MRIKVISLKDMAIESPPLKKGDLGLPWRDLVGIYRNLSSYIRSPFFATHQSPVWARGVSRSWIKSPPTPLWQRGEIGLLS